MIEFVDFSVKRGGFFLKVPKLRLDGKRNFLIGRNGSGKSTFLFSVAGLIRSEGGIFIDGVEISQIAPEERGIALIPQELLLFPTMRVRGNIEISVRYGRGDKGLVDRLIRSMEIESLLDKKIQEISSGEAQKVAVARAVVSKPRVLLMDEPFSFQDEIARVNILALVDELAEEYNFDYIYATHNNKDLEGGFSTLTSIDGGELVESVDSMQTIRHYRTLSLTGYTNLVVLDKKYYRIERDAITFSSLSGIRYDTLEGIGAGKIRFKIDGRYYFASVPPEPGKPFLNIDSSKLVELPY